MNLFYEQLERECDPDLIHLDLTEDEMKRILLALRVAAHFTFHQDNNPFTILSNKLRKKVIK